MGAISEDEWQRRATAAAIAAARKIANSGTMPTGVPVGKLSDSEWGWLFSAALFAWIAKRAEQAVAEGSDIEAKVRDGMTCVNSPWNAGAIAATLPELAATAKIDWAKPLAAWSKETMIEFLGTGYDLIWRANRARDLGGGVTQEKGPDRIARETNAGAGNPAVVADELNDIIPF
jgi:hypothetical protein